MGNYGRKQHPFGGVGGGVHQQGGDRHSTHFRANHGEQQGVVEPVDQKAGQQIAEMQVCKETDKAGDCIGDNGQHNTNTALGSHFRIGAMRQGEKQGTDNAGDDGLCRKTKQIFAGPATHDAAENQFFPRGLHPGGQQHKQNQESELTGVDAAQMDVAGGHQSAKHKTDNEQNGKNQAIFFVCGSADTEDEILQRSFAHDLYCQNHTPKQGNKGQKSVELSGCKPHNRRGLRLDAERERCAQRKADEQAHCQHGDPSSEGTFVGGNVLFHFRFLCHNFLPFTVSETETVVFLCQNWNRGIILQQPTEIKKFATVPDGWLYVDYHWVSAVEAISSDV